MPITEGLGRKKNTEISSRILCVVLTLRHQYTLSVTGPLVDRLFAVPHYTKTSSTGLCVVVMALMDWGAE